MIELIQKLVEAWGPSGYEHQVRALIQEEVQDLCDEMHVDGLGNLICRVGEGGKRVMVSAHMDEIGLMANYAEPNTRYLRFSNIGGVRTDTLHGNRVMFEDGTMGVVAKGGKGKGTNLSEFFIDVQAEDGEMMIEPGSPCSFWREMQQRGNRVISKAMDDRIGCVVGIEAMRRLKETGTQHEVYFVFSVQEEVGLRGARAAAYGVDPDVGIALDVTRTGDEIQNSKMDVKLGGGAAIKIIDSGLVVPKPVINWMIERAEADGIPYQRELLLHGTTDAASIQTARAGVPSGCISIPTRYIHTTSETVDLSDVQACVDLLTGLLTNEIELN